MDVIMNLDCIYTLYFVTMATLEMRACLVNSYKNIGDDDDVLCSRTL